MYCIYHIVCMQVNNAAAFPICFLFRARVLPQIDKSWRCFWATRRLSQRFTMWALMWLDWCEVKFIDSTCAVNSGQIWAEDSRNLQRIWVGSHKPIDINRSHTSVLSSLSLSLFLDLSFLHSSTSWTSYLSRMRCKRVETCWNWIRESG